MGQTQSAEAAAVDARTQQESTTSSALEAVAYGNGDTESLYAKAQKALECPCIADLRSGPCGAQFSEAFLCFMKSTSEEKGSDCFHGYISLQSCIKANSDAFSKDTIDSNKVMEKEATEELRIIPPVWSREAKSPKPKL